MTFNQITNSQRIEDARHNLAVESENVRHNKQWENESARHNLATEREIYRSNVERERLERNRQMQDYRMHKDNLSQGYQRLSLDAWRNQTNYQLGKESNALRARDISNQYALGRQRNELEKSRLDEQIRATHESERQKDQQLMWNNVWNAKRVEEEHRANVAQEQLKKSSIDFYQNTEYPHNKKMDVWGKINDTWYNKNKSLQTFVDGASKLAPMIK